MNRAITPCDHRDLMRGLRELRADHRGVTLREVVLRTGGTDVEVRVAINRACARGEVVRLGRSPSGSQLFGLTSRPDVPRPQELPPRTGRFTRQGSPA